MRSLNIHISSYSCVVGFTCIDKISINVDRIWTHENSLRMAFNLPSAEKKPLKRARLGPPDVYPQEHRQKEV